MLLMHCSSVESVHCCGGVERRAIASCGRPTAAQVDWSALAYKDGLGAALKGTWKSATSVSGGDAFATESLGFSALGIVNLRLFADLGRLPATRGEQWAQGARATLQVLNVFDSRQSIQDAVGITPIAFAPGYLDPVGRTVWLTVRKAFQ